MNTLPNQQQRRAGMAALRASALASKLRVLESGQCFTASGKPRKLTAAERAHLEADVAVIRAAQRKFGETA